MNNESIPNQPVPNDHVIYQIYTLLNNRNTDKIDSLNKNSNKETWSGCHNLNDETDFFLTLSIFKDLVKVWSK